MDHNHKDEMYIHTKFDHDRLWNVEDNGRSMTELRGPVPGLKVESLSISTLLLFAYILTETTWNVDTLIQKMAQN